MGFSCRYTMGTVSRILGENDETVQSWPITIEYSSSLTIRDLSHAMTKYKDALDYSQTRPAAEAIEEALKIRELSVLLDKSRHPETSVMKQILKGDPFSEEEEDDWEGNDGLILEGDQIDGVIEWVDTIREAEDYVRDTGATGFLATANRHVSRAIGTWLKSIGVPFEYNIDPDVESKLE